MVYSQLFQITDPALTSVAVPATGDGYGIDLIPQTTVPGGIIPDWDFVTRASGEVEAVPNSASDGTFLFEWAFVHWAGDPARQFTSRRQSVQYLGHQIAFSVPLASFNSVVRVQADRNIPIDAGGTYRIGALDLQNPMSIRLRLYVRAYQLPSLSDRRAATLATLRILQGSVNFWQADMPEPETAAQRGMRPPTVTAFRQKFTEFSVGDFADAAISRAITTAWAMVGGNRSEEIALNAAAHLALLNRGASPTGQPDGGAGEVAKDSLGPESHDYRTMTADEDRDTFFATTPYGRIVLMLEARNYRIRFPVVA